MLGLNSTEEEKSDLRNTFEVNWVEFGGWTFHPTLDIPFRPIQLGLNLDIQIREQQNGCWGGGDILQNGILEKDQICNEIFMSLVV